MKKCDHFRDLILTDYMDGQLDKNAAAIVENHLLDCSDCRVFFKEVKDNVAVPFDQPLQQPVPAELWRSIRQKIEDEDKGNRFCFPEIEDIVDKLKRLIVFPRMVPVFASLILMFLAGSVTLNTMQVQRAKDKDQGEYLVSLLSPAGSADNNEGSTPIEHYFL